MTLEVRVEPAVAGGLRVIGHLPAIRPCRLEGRNGIGKSALVRVLVLISGNQPYPGDTGAWRSLRALVGPTTVTIHGLAGSFSTARVALTPDRWPADPSMEIGEWLGTVRLDGEPASVAALTSALDVVHLTGTEKLQDTLQHQYPRLAVATTEISRRLSELETKRAELGELCEELARVSPRSAAVERASSDEATQQRQQIAQQLRTAAPRAEDLTKAAGLQALLDSGDAAEHQEKLKELRSRLDLVRGGLPDAEAKHDAAVAALEAGSGAQQQAAKLERKFRALNRKQDQLQSRQAELAARLEEIGAPSDIETLDEQQTADLAEHRSQAIARQQQERLQAARRQRSEVENDVLDELRVVLTDAVARGLGTTVLAHFNDEDVTVADLIAALGQVAELGDLTDEGLIAANADVSEWAELERVFSERADLKASLARIIIELRELEPQLGGQDELREAAAAARESLDAVTNEVRVVQGQIGALNQSGLGGRDLIDAQAHVDELLAKHQVDSGDLVDVLARAQADLYDLQRSDRDLKQQIEDFAAATVRRRVQRDSLRRRAGSEPDLAWLVEVASTVEDVKRGPADWADETWQLLADHGAAVRHALSGLSSDVSGLQAAADQKARSGRHLHAITAVIEEDAVAQLSAMPIADALFDGGRVQRVSMEDQSITWTTSDGEQRTRPLSVFSSGEQALGFIRARLQQVASTQSQNRLIFLDEFGAFVAADRRRPLAELLTSDDLLGLSDQVVVILPLQSDYEAELEQTTGQLRDTYARRAQDITDRGYFTEAFQQ